MATNRKIVFINDGFYHVFNRGIEKRPVFTDKREFYRAKELLRFYQYKKIPIKYSHFKSLPREKQQRLWEILVQSGRIVEIISFCLMPNHFHLLLKQIADKGVSQFVANFTNAYTKYFNIKHERIGSLFEGVFKAVYVENDEQLIHLSRYIHLNPVASSLINTVQLEGYTWSSYPEYVLEKSGDKIIKNNQVLDMFKSIADYKSFVLDQINYAKELEKIKHKVLE